MNSFSQEKQFQDIRLFRTFNIGMVVDTSKIFTNSGNGFTMQYGTGNNLTTLIFTKNIITINKKLKVGDTIFVDYFKKYQQNVIQFNDSVFINSNLRTNGLFQNDNGAIIFIINQSQVIPILRVLHIFSATKYLQMG